MVLRDIEEEVEETEPMSPSPKKRKPLHNFTFPFLKWGTQRNLRCSNAAINDGAGTSTSGGGGDHRSSSATPSGSVQRRRVVIGFGGDDDDDDDDDDQGIAVVREKLMHDLKTATDRMKNAILNEESDEASEEERESLNLKSWSIRKRQKTEMKAPITISGNANAKRDFTSPARIDGAVAVAGGNSVSSRLRSNITSSNKIERQKFSLHLLSKEIEEDFVAMVGRGPRKRPTKRPRNVQRQINNIFPGLWLREVNDEMYEVVDTNQNGKSGKRKGRGKCFDDDDESN